MTVDALDHLVLTVRDVEATCDFYQRALGMTVVTFGQGRKALEFGRQKINLHQFGYEREPKAHRPTPGSADLCFTTATPVGDILREWVALRVTVVEGPVARTGATGRLLSLYTRDPDGNLIEIANEAS